MGGYTTNSVHHCSCFTWDSSYELMLLWFCVGLQVYDVLFLCSFLFPLACPYVERVLPARMATSSYTHSLTHNHSMNISSWEESNEEKRAHIGKHHLEIWQHEGKGEYIYEIHFNT
jgi:hypothetical protein